ncbi:MAG TPA: Mut7-C RNAse domain-containing protein, partial [Woeseiaceae bacterium]|nr:Mut7-C RNAse domain-containing protein [Woeseiaceae bacterium]
QVREVVDQLDLARLVRVFSRCMICNAPLEQVAESDVRDRLPPGIRGRFELLARCPGCERVYWPGSHYERMVDLVKALLPD